MADPTTPARDTWRSALDQLTADHEGEQVTIEILDPSVGYQHEADRLPFSYLSYDPKDDVVVIAVGGRSRRYPVVLRHLVYQPSEVDIVTGDVSQPAVRIVEPDSTTTLVVFHPDET
jgi:hypothetical protein